MSGLDAASNVTAVWADSAGIESSVRTAAGRSWESVTAISADASATAPDLAELSVDGSQLAVWVSGGNIQAASGSGGVFGTGVSVTTTGTASSPQAAIINGKPTVYFIDGNAIESSTFDNLVWSAPAAVATLGTGTISDLRVSVTASGAGAAAWLRNDSGTVNLDTATISAGAWTVSTDPPLSTTATAVAVASNGGTSAVAWTEASAGLQVAVSGGSGFVDESNATEAGATDPAAAVDAAGHVFVTSVSGGSVQAEIRTGANAWAVPDSLGSGATPSISAGSSGDVVVIWPGSLHAYDATPPTVTVVAPSSPAPPGSHDWSVTASDVWSSPGTTSWAFVDHGNAAGGGNGSPVSHVDNVPGPEMATATQTDGAGNVATDSASITISAVGPQNNTPPKITNGSNPVAGGTLTSSAGTWSGNPTPTVGHVWQRCSTGQNCTTVQTGGSTYPLTAADVGSRIRVEETASNDGGSVTLDTAETPVVAPHSTAAPTLNPDTSLADGTALTADSPPSSWGGATGLTLVYHFQSCNGSCTEVQATTSNTYTLHASDVGTTMQVMVVATAGPVDGLVSANATATSSQTGVVAPKATAAPTLTGGVQDGQTLTAHSPDSSWDGATGLTLTYVFAHCDADGGNCVQVQNGPSAAYTLKGSDLGFRVVVTVMALKNGSDPATSDSSALTAVISPSNTATPGVPSGTTQDGATLTASNGTWLHQNLLTFTYQWYGCAPVSACVPLANGNSSTYVLTAADVGTTIQVTVSASATTSPGVGVTTVTSGSTVPIQPQNTGAASITPPSVQQDGKQFTASTGGWHGASNLTFVYQWKRCDATGNGCVSIPNTNDSSYIAGASDVGNTLRVTVSASKNSSAITGSPDSSQSAVIAPLSTGLPTLGGAPQDTQTLTPASLDSTWDGVTGLTKTFQFSRCDSNGANCTSQGSGTTYLLGFADIGSTIRVTAVASKNGSAQIASSPSAQTAVITPLLTGAPTAPTGATQDGQVLTANQGTWAHQANLQAANGFRYQWFQCTSGSTSSCTTSLDAAGPSSTYTLQPTDVGQRIAVVVTAFVGTGATSSTSTPTLAVAPLNTAASVIATPSTQQDGQVFSASPGGWDNATGLNISYQWKRCDSTGAGCATIGGATGQTYTATANDVGQTLKVTASAAKGGSATTLSQDSAATAVLAARNTTVPQISGSPTDGQTLSIPASTTSAWDNTPAALTFAYQWVRCDKDGNNCAAITGATSLTYILTADDVADAGDATARHEIRVRVTATVNGASVTAQSAQTAQIGALATSNTALPQVVGGAFNNTTLSVNKGGWNGTGIQDQSFQWVRCDPPLAVPVCTNLGPASLTATTYLVQGADVNHYITVIETVVNRLGATMTARAPFSNPVLLNPLQATDFPVVTGNYVDGGVLTTTDGVWSPPDNLAFSYKWLRCAPNGDGSPLEDSGTCPSIPGATSSTYTVTADDVGQYVVARVRADYTAGIGIDSTQDSDTEGLPQVTAAPPANTGKPTIAGAAHQDNVLTASPGTWSGTNTHAFPITFGYQWLRCDGTGGACQPIAGATQASYTPSAQDVGSRLLVRVTASNTGGSASFNSDPTVLVVGNAPPPAGGAGGGSTPVTSAGGAGGSGGSHPATSGADKSAPKLALTFLGGGVLRGGTTLQVNATCPKTEKSCKAKVRLLATLKKTTGKAVAKPVTVASAVVTFKGGQKKLVKLKLSPAARAFLKKSLKLKVTLIASVTDAAGNITPRQTKGLTLRWKKG